MTKRKKKLEPLPGDRCIARIGDYGGLEIWQGQMHEFGAIDGSPMSDEDVTELRDELSAYLAGRLHTSLAEPEEECASRSENMTCTTPDQDERGRIFMALAMRKAQARSLADAGSEFGAGAVTAYEDAIAIVKGEA